MTTRDPRIPELPGIVQALAHAFGYDVGERMMIEFGGQQVSIPQRPMRSSRLYQVLGPEPAKWLSRHYGASQIEVPIGASMKAAARNRAIAAHPGSHNEAARAAGVTRRWVRMVRKEAKRPLPLFEGLSKRP